MSTVPFGEWLPDLPDLGNSALIAKNVYPDDRSYRQVLSFANAIAALTERAQGATSARSSAGITYNYVGTATKLQELSASTSAWTDRSGTTYSCASADFWQFVKFGNYMVATQIGDAIQYTTIGAGTNFANLSATAPKARHAAVIREFLFVGNTWDATDGFRPARAWWSGIDDITNWPTPGSTTAANVQSDYQDLAEGGSITGITGGQSGVIVCERSVYTVNYIGSPFVFDIQRVEKERGSTYAGSVVGDGRYTYYLGNDGFYRFDGIQSVPIGAGKVDRWFLDDLAPNSSPRICSALDPANNLVLWAYASLNSGAGTPDKIICYHTPSKRWAIIEQPVEWLAQISYTLGYTLDGLDAVSSSLDALPYSLDSYVWQGGVALLGAFDTSHRFGYFNGSAMAATITTGEVQPVANSRALVDNVRPLVQSVGTSVSTTPIYRSRLIDTATTGTASVINSVGTCPIGLDDRYFRFQVDITGGFQHAQGVEVEASASGTI
jgi:hypothetical protein